MSFISSQGLDTNYAIVTTTDLNLTNPIKISTPSASTSNTQVGYLAQFPIVGAALISGNTQTTTYDIGLGTYMVNLNMQVYATISTSYIAIFLDNGITPIAILEMRNDDLEVTNAAAFNYNFPLNVALFNNNAANNLRIDLELTFAGGTVTTTDESYLNVCRIA